MQKAKLIWENPLHFCSMASKIVHHIQICLNFESGIWHKSGIDEYPWVIDSSRASPPYNLTDIYLCWRTRTPKSYTKVFPKEVTIGKRLIAVSFMQPNDLTVTAHHHSPPTTNDTTEHDTNEPAVEYKTTPSLILLLFKWYKQSLNLIAFQFIIEPKDPWHLKKPLQELLPLFLKSELHRKPLLPMISIHPKSFLRIIWPWKERTELVWWRLMVQWLGLETGDIQVIWHHRNF